MKPRILVAFASVSGNTAETARLCVQAMQHAGAEVTGPENVRAGNASLLCGFHGVLLGAPTWGEGAHHPDFVPFDQSMLDQLVPGALLAGTRAAAFGGCDRAYRHFGRAIELLEDGLLQCGAQIVQRGLKIELAHNQHSRAATSQWALDFLARITGEKSLQPYRPAMTTADVDQVMGISPQERSRRDNAGLMP